MQHIWSFFPSKYYLYKWFIIHVEMLVYQSATGWLSKLLLAWNYFRTTCWSIRSTKKHQGSFNHTPPPNTNRDAENHPLEKEKHLLFNNFLGSRPFVFGCLVSFPSKKPNRWNPEKKTTLETLALKGECTTRCAGNCDWSLLKSRWQDRFVGGKNRFLGVSENGGFFPPNHPF